MASGTKSENYRAMSMLDARQNNGVPADTVLPKRVWLLRQPILLQRPTTSFSGAVDEFLICFATIFACPEKEMAGTP